MGTTMDVTQEKNTLNELIKTQDELEQWIYSVTMTSEPLSVISKALVSG